LGSTRGLDDALVITDFSVGPTGVGPVMGFGSDDFFPSVSGPDPGRDEPRTGGGNADSA
jgi:hypothetical protein